MAAGQSRRAQRYFSNTPNLEPIIDQAFESPDGDFLLTQAFQSLILKVAGYVPPRVFAEACEQLHREMIRTAIELAFHRMAIRFRRVAA